jgi:hypothetical protein
MHLPHMLFWTEIGLPKDNNLESSAVKCKDK